MSDGISLDIVATTAIHPTRTHRHGNQRAAHTVCETLVAAYVVAIHRHRGSEPDVDVSATSIAGRYTKFNAA